MAPKLSLPSDSEIRQILIDRIDGQNQSVGIAVGVIGPDERRVTAHGHLEKGDSRPLNGDTIFEIGSVTKVFTALLLADMVLRNEVALDDPVAKYLPATFFPAKMPERNGRSITLVDLATHTSGLPRLPANLSFQNRANPYADYSVGRLYQFLSTHQLGRDVGSQYEYSNLGGGLLGHVLGLRAGMEYGLLVRSRICEPLGMDSTQIMLTPEMKAREAVGHNQTMDTVPNWDVPTLAGAGALRSTANDLLTFLAANLGYTSSPLTPAMAAMLEQRRPTGQPSLEIALGWHILTAKEIVWHNGGTGGYRSFVGFNPKTGVGVVALSNASTTIGVDDIAMHLLDPSVPLWKPAKEHEEVAVDPNVLDGYCGRYELNPNAILTVTRDANRLFVQAVGTPKIEIFPQTDRDYFLKLMDAHVTFVTDANGRATELILRQSGRDDRHAKRIEEEPGSVRFYGK
jgi:D-alanyl-D-alanine-carboxypeptidase/D-alanyl-D-alanine-endopeptidase